MLERLQSQEAHEIRKNQEGFAGVEEEERLQNFLRHFRFNLQADNNKRYHKPRLHWTETIEYPTEILEGLRNYN